MIDPLKVLRIAAKKWDQPIIYDDFSKLHPRGKAGSYHLHQVKRILLTNGWAVHERR